MAIFCAKKVGVLALKTLVALELNVNSIVTVSGEGEKELLRIAKNKGIKFFIDIDIKNKRIQDTILKETVDLVLCFSYPKIIPLSFLERLNGNVFNFHPAKLPDYRGCFPTVWPILNNDLQAHYTLHLMNKYIDAGPIVDRTLVNIKSTDTGWSLYLKLITSLPGFIEKNIKRIFNNQIQLSEQDNKKADYYPNKLPRNGYFQWNSTGSEIEKFVRALYHPKLPCAKSFINNYEVEVLEIHTIEHQDMECEPGILQKRSDELRVSCLDGWVKLKTIRIDGKLQNYQI